MGIVARRPFLAGWPPTVSPGSHPPPKPLTIRPKGLTIRPKGAGAIHAVARHAWPAVLRDRTLTPERQIAFARAVGQPQANLNALRFGVDGSPQPRRISNIAERRPARRHPPAGVSTASPASSEIATAGSVVLPTIRTFSKAVLDGVAPANPLDRKPCKPVIVSLCSGLGSSLAHAAKRSQMLRSAHALAPCRATL